MTEKTLFIPLKTEFFEAFEQNRKNTEYRLYGKRWNENTCHVGRTVVLSKGYGKQNRLIGEITAFEKSELPTKSEAWISCYGQTPNAFAACITLGNLRRVW